MNHTAYPFGPIVVCCGLCFVLSNKKYILCDFYQHKREEATNKSNIIQFYVVLYFTHVLCCFFCTHVSERGGWLIMLVLVCNVVLYKYVAHIFAAESVQVSGIHLPVLRAYVYSRMREVAGLCLCAVLCDTKFCAYLCIRVCSLVQYTCLFCEHMFTAQWVRWLWLMRRNSLLAFACSGDWLGWRLISNCRAIMTGWLPHNHSSTLPNGL